MYRAVRPLVFRMDPEKSHLRALRTAERTSPFMGVMRWRVRDPRLAQRVWGLRFPNPVGLGAGYDKWGRGITAWQRLGFGFAEIGTITALAQNGNPTPRLVRLPADQAIIASGPAVFIAANCAATLRSAGAKCWRVTIWTVAFSARANAAFKARSAS